MNQNNDVCILSSCSCESSSYHKDVFKATRMAKQRFRIQSTLIPPFPPPCYSAYAIAFSWVSRSFTGKVKTTRPQDEVSLLMPISPNGIFAYFILTNGRDILFRVLVRSVLHDDVIKWKHFPRYWPFVRGIHRWSMNSPHKGQWRGALMISLICAWINGWVNNRDAGDLRRLRFHYDVIAMYESDDASLSIIRSHHSIHNTNCIEG